jgi:hypothetical protein
MAKSKKQVVYVGSRYICGMARKLADAGQLAHPIIPRTLHRWVYRKTRTNGSKYSPVKRERDIPFPVPAKAIKRVKRKGRMTFVVDKQFLYLIIAWSNARNGGRLDWENFARELEREQEHKTSIG